MATNLWVGCFISLLKALSPRRIASSIVDFLLVFRQILINFCSLSILLFTWIVQLIILSISFVIKTVHCFLVIHSQKLIRFVRVRSWIEGVGSLRRFSMTVRALRDESCGLASLRAVSVHSIDVWRGGWGLFVDHVFLNFF